MITLPATVMNKAVDFTTACEVANFPYGGDVRTRHTKPRTCKARFWVETWDIQGRSLQRSARKTTKPGTEVWLSSIRHGEYAPLVILYTDGNGEAHFWEFTEETIYADFKLLELSGILDQLKTDQDDRLNKVMRWNSSFRSHEMDRWAELVSHLIVHPQSTWSMSALKVEGLSETIGGMDYYTALWRATGKQPQWKEEYRT